MDCTICQTKIEENKVLLSCEHKYHLYCFIDFIYKNNTNLCPICNVEIIGLDEYRKRNLILRQKNPFYYRNSMERFERETRDIIRKLEEKNNKN